MDLGWVDRATHRRVIWRLLPGLAIAIFLSAGEAATLNIQTYLRAEGIPQNQVKGVIQDGRGYLWLGTHSGLSRYNGQAFRTFTTADGLSSNSIDHLALGPTGRLIVGTWNGGVCFHEQPGFVCLQETDGLPSDAVQALTRVDNILWVGTDKGLAAINLEDRTVTIPDVTLPDPSVLDIASSDRGIWIATEKGAALLIGGQLRRPSPIESFDGPVQAITVHDGALLLGRRDGVHTWEEQQIAPARLYPDKLDQPRITGFTTGPDGTLWVAAESGVVRLDDRGPTFIDRDSGLSSAYVHDIFVDRERTIWFGTNTGLSKLVPSPFDAYTTDDGLSHPFVRSLTEAPDGSIWLGTREGVDILENDRIRVLPLPDQWSQKKIYAIEPAPAGGMLIGSRHGLLWWHDGETVILGREDGLPSTYVGSLEPDPAGGVWIGTKNGLAKWQDGTVSTVDHPELEGRFILAMHEDGPGRVWLGLASNGVRKFDGDRVETFDDSRELTNETIWAVEKGMDGSIWVGSNGDGAFRIKGDVIERMDASRGLASNFVWQILCDGDGRIWFYTNSGLDRFADGQLLHYGKSSGLIALEGSTNAALEHSEGDHYFGTGQGLVRFSSEFELASIDPPPVRIESIRTPTNGRVRSGVELSHDYGNLTLEYTALTFRTESSIRFQTRVLGLDDEWSEPTSLSRIRLGQLPAGEYDFQVIARNDMGEWSDEPAAFHFTVLPVWWQTPWFWGLALVGFVAVTGGYVQLRLRRLRAIRQQLEQQVDEQTARLQASNEELRRLSITDELTGLYNRRHLVERLENELERLNRTESPIPLSFAILDLDHFKRINDIHGHVIGDRVLQTVGERITSRIRQTDLAARYGGEEFAIIMPMTDSEGARILIEDLRRSFDDEALRVIPGKPTHLTVSAGVATETGRAPEVDTGHRLEQIVRKADDMLYRAKEKGRNRTEPAGPDFPGGN